MPLSRTSTGRIHHRDFTVDQSCPAWLTEAVAGTGAITYGATGATLNASGDSSGAMLVSTDALSDLENLVIRVKAKKTTTTNLQFVTGAGVWDKAAPRPTCSGAAWSWGEPSIELWKTAGAVDEIRCYKNGVLAATLFTPAVSATFYLSDIYYSATDFYAVARSATDRSVLGSHNAAVTISNLPWFYVGDSHSAAASWNRGTTLVETIDMMTSYNITVTSTPTGSAARLYDTSGTLIDSSAEAGGSIVLDGATCDFNSCPDKSWGGFRGRIVVYEDGTYSKPLTTYRSNSIWGGDEYAYTQGVNKVRRPCATGMRR